MHLPVRPESSSTALPSGRRVLAALLLAWGSLCLGGSARVAVAQGATGSMVASTAVAPPRYVTVETRDATRAELTTAMTTADRQSRDARLSADQRRQAAAQAQAIRARLETGDVQVGDRFEVTLTTDSVRRREVTVKEGGMVDMDPLPPVSVAGALNAEVQPRIQRYLAGFYRDPQVRVQPLVRLLVIGAVGKPGPVVVAPDLPVSDVLPAAGGVGGRADLGKVEVRRDGRKIVSGKRFRQLMADGQTLAQAGIRTGDEIKVGEERRISWAFILTRGVFALTAFIGLLRLIQNSQN